MKKVRSALSTVEGVTIDEVAMPDVAKISYTEGEVDLKDVKKALKDAGYPAKKREAKEEEAAG